MHSVSLKQLKEHFKLEVITPGIDLSNKFISLPEVNRPGLLLAGYNEFFEAGRIQIVGKVEYSYMLKMNRVQRTRNLRKLFAHKIPCLVISRELEVFDDMLNAAIEFDVPLLRWNSTTTDFIAEVLSWLKVHLAPRITLHGVLVDIYGEGTLIMGESGIGKSETAMELIRRGHRLVADDAVEIKKVSNQTLFGTCPEVIRYFMELRGIGVIDVRRMFGVQSVKETQNIDLVIKLENWDPKKEYDRLGMEDNYMEILGNKVVCQEIPIRPGRNLAIICEAAAINFRQKKMGYNSASILIERKINEGTL